MVDESKTTKLTICNNIANDLEISRSLSLKITNFIIREMVKSLYNEGLLKIAGFGSFKIKTYAAKKGRNIKTGENIHIPQQRYPIFTPSTALKSKITKQR